MLIHLESLRAKLKKILAQSAGAVEYTDCAFPKE